MTNRGSILHFDGPNLSSTDDEKEELCANLGGGVARVAGSVAGSRRPGRAVSVETNGLPITTDGTSPRETRGPLLLFDGKRTPWRVRAAACDGRYSIATCSVFGRVLYTIVDWQEKIRGPLNIVGQGMGIFTTSGPDPAIDETVRLLEEPDGGWEVSYRNRVPLRAGK